MAQRFSLGVCTLLVCAALFCLALSPVPLRESAQDPWAVCDMRQRCQRSCLAATAHLNLTCCTAQMLALVRAVRRASATAGGVEILAVAGTLLGGLREHGGILPWIVDVDLGVPSADLPRLLDALRLDPTVGVFIHENIWRVCPALPPGASALEAPPALRKVRAHDKVAYVDLFEVRTGEGVPPTRFGEPGVAIGKLKCNPLPLSMVYPLRAEPLCLYNDTSACLGVMARAERYLEHLYGLKYALPPPMRMQRLHGAGGHACWEPALTRV